MDRIRVLAINVILSVVVIAFIALVMKLDRDWLPPIPRVFELLFWPLFLLGSFIIIWAVITLLKHSGASGAPADPTRKLVTAGPYRWQRNPIYFGDILLLFGVAFFTRSLALFFVALFSIPCVDLFVRCFEEPRTERRFGGDYRKYKQSVPRWIPQIPRR
jgi:protein-S-isoprenylcysteine O-methyltransferase Ste14